ncbi:MAG: hydrogenase expression/formation protein HypE [Vicinamibacterales bacterium]
MSTPTTPAFSCPVPVSRHEHVLLGHGGGGQMTQLLLEQIFLPAFSNAALDARHDGAALLIGGLRLAFSTDSYVVKPMFFPGGNIGTLAVNGTVNDLAMCGARPQFLSTGFIIEEGLPIETLRQVVASMQLAAAAAGVQLVTGDTKVVDRGKGDGLYVNTAGIGIIEAANPIAPSSVRSGDVILLSGDIGRHGMAVMAAREGLAFESEIESDCAPVAAPVLNLIEAGLDVHCLRDLTRGGLASALVEIAETSRLHLGIEDALIAVREDVRGACEILGLDPLYVANEGRFVVFVPEAEAELALEVLSAHAVSANAMAIGRVTQDPRGLVTLKSLIGVTRIVDRLSGEQLPRIC